MHLRFNFDACPVHSPFGFVHLTHQNLSARALFCLNSLTKVNTQLLICKYFRVLLFRGQPIVDTFQSNQLCVYFYLLNEHVKEKHCINNITKLTSVICQRYFATSCTKLSINGACSDPIGLFSKLLQFWYHKNSYIFLIIILKFHAFIPCPSEEYIRIHKNLPILLITVVTTI